MAKKELESAYEPQKIESRVYDFWMKERVFHASEKSPHAKNYTIVLPPPNVTGVLHMGHALTCTLEDILIRRKRMQGYQALWVPGTDHAGIATQMVVERNLQKTEGKNRHDLGREAFLERVWKWKEESQQVILRQLKQMGCSLDWDRLRFTMDEHSSRAVRVAFVRLYNEKLIYRDVSAQQWCPRCLTVLSDLEVKHRESKGKIYQIFYASEGNPKEGLTVATTRPETLFGDVAVAVHPEDARHKKWIGKKVILPLLNKAIPVIADTYVDKEFGTGALKITPNHDPNDYQVALRHKLPGVQIFDDRAILNENTGKFKGLTRDKAREQVVSELTQLGLLKGEKDHVNQVAVCDRCDTLLEPKISKQWFVDAKVLAKPAIEAVQSGKIKIIPQEWEKTYFEWMNNIRPWCISRQLWWGHRIPIWTCGSCHFEGAFETDPKECPKCKNNSLSQDNDVLDTWFSSGLWPFSTLGWPDETQDLKAFYPNSVMETGFDILFFWVARMIMLGIKMRGEVPFHTVYLHPMVRDEYGQKMSKTKGNVKDPLDIINHSGADALRFTLAAMAVHGRDVLLSDQRIEGYRNFGNKIWNAGKFLLMHFGALSESKKDFKNETNQWIWTRLQMAKNEVNEALDQYRFFDAANTLYRFVWNEFCDWFIEFIKHPEEMERRKKEKDTLALEVFEEALQLLHPIMPFLTEEMWQSWPVRGKETTISKSPYPSAEGQTLYKQTSETVDQVVKLIETIRSKRGESNLNPNVEITVHIHSTEEKWNVELKKYEKLIQRLAKAKSLSIGAKPAFTVPQVLLVTPPFEIRIPRDELIDKATEREKTAKELKMVEQELERAEAKLKSDSFVSKAPPDVIQGVKERAGILQKKIGSLKDYLKELDS